MSDSPPPFNPDAKFAHRLIFPSGDIGFYNAEPKFSNFDFILTNLAVDRDVASLHRCFSLARGAGMNTVVLEKIDPAGIIAAENEDLGKDYPGYKCLALFRVSFWRESFKSLTEWDQKKDVASPLGYLICKSDFVPNKKDPKRDVHGKYHVFEAVFSDRIFMREGSNRFSHCSVDYEVTLVNRRFVLSGVLFAQQNSLSKCCAHVALYSIISMYNPRDLEPSFSKMNTILGLTPHEAAQGLNFGQIKKILEVYGLKFTYYDRKKYPFQRIIYSGVESGGGALLAFETANSWREKVRSRLRRIPVVRHLISQPPGHIIPCWGHVFEKDIWIPLASRLYFKINNFKKTSYYASDNWTSHFIAHDDNFGCNLLIPRDYVRQNQISYCIEIHNEKVGMYTAANAEVLALNTFETIFLKLENLYKNDSKNEFETKWLGRLSRAIKNNSLVLRTFAVSRTDYFDHLRKATDWSNHQENSATVDDLEQKIVTEYFWITEISLLQLFSANERKLCDVLGDPDKLSNKQAADYMLLVRIPGFYAAKIDGGLKYFRSDLESHIKNLSVAHKAHRRLDTGL